MKRERIIILLLFSILWCGIIPAQQEREIKEVKPNIILVVVDDLGWKDVGFMGSSFYETPNIDRIARGGMIFLNAYSAGAVCSPGRASLMTGRYPVRMGITDQINGSDYGKKIQADDKNRGGFETPAGKLLKTPLTTPRMEKKEVTLAEVFKNAGYITAHIGKWNLGSEGHFPEQQGFDINIGGVDFGGTPSYFAPFEAGGNKIKNLPAAEEGEYLTDVEGNEAVKFIRVNKDKPFFLNLSHYAVHPPMQAKEELISKYIAKAKADSTLPGWTPAGNELNPPLRSKQPLQGQRNPVYAAMIESVDRSFGQIIRALAEEGIFDNTIIVFTSDNGGNSVLTDNSPARGGKGTPYEGGIRVPLAVYYPLMIKPHSTCQTPVMNIDLFPTLIGMAGREYDPVNAIDGKNLIPLLKKEGDIEARDLYWHYPHYRGEGKVKPFSAVRAGNYKLIRNYEGQSFELYDLKNDSGERNNLAFAMQDKVKELNRKLSQWLRSVGGILPKPAGERENSL